MSVLLNSRKKFGTKSPKVEKKQKVEISSKEMKIFQRIEQNLAVLGLAPYQQQSDHLKLNFRQIIFFVVCAINVTLMSSYAFLVANGIGEYMDVIFSLIVVVCISFGFISSIYMNDKSHATIKLLEKELVLSE